MWDLQGNGGSVAATTERILGGRGLERVSFFFLLRCSFRRGGQVSGKGNRVDTYNLSYLLASSFDFFFPWEKRRSARGGKKEGGMGYLPMEVGLSTQEEKHIKA